MVDLWKEKYLVVKRKYDELSEYNKSLRKELSCVQRQIVELEADKEMIAMRLERRKGEADNQSISIQSYPTAPPPLISISEHTN